METENISTGALLKKCAIALVIAFGILAALILIPVGLIEWKQAATIRRIEKEAAVYLDEAYPGHDFQWEAYYGEKRQCFIVEVWSQSSRDTRFELKHRGDDGGFIRDTYEFAVLTCNTTRSRVSEEYDAAVQAALKDIPVYKVEANFFGAGGSCRVGEAISATDTVQWVLDQEYDVSQVGAQIGYVILLLDNTKEEYPEARRDELVCQTARALKEAGIGFYAIDIMLADTRYYGSPVFHFEQRFLCVDLAVQN